MTVQGTYINPTRNSLHSNANPGSIRNNSGSSNFSVIYPTIMAISVVCNTQNAAKTVSVNVHRPANKPTGNLGNRKISTQNNASKKHHKPHFSDKPRQMKDLQTPSKKSSGATQNVDRSDCEDQDVKKAPANNKPWQTPLEDPKKSLIHKKREKHRRLNSIRNEKVLQEKAIHRARDEKLFNRDCLPGIPDEDELSFIKVTPTLKQVDCDLVEDNFDRYAFMEIPEDYPEQTGYEEDFEEYVADAYESEVSDNETYPLTQPKDDFNPFNFATFTPPPVPTPTFEPQAEYTSEPIRMIPIQSLNSSLTDSDFFAGLDDAAPLLGRPAAQEVATLANSVILISKAPSPDNITSDSSRLNKDAIKLSLSADMLEFEDELDRILNENQSGTVSKVDVKVDSKVNEASVFSEPKLPKMASTQPKQVTKPSVDNRVKAKAKRVFTKTGSIDVLKNDFKIAFDYTRIDGNRSSSQELKGVSTYADIDDAAETQAEKWEFELKV